MKNKETLISLIEVLQEERFKRTSKLESTILENIEPQVQEELLRLTAELNEKLNKFRMHMEDEKRTNAENINLDICAINRIISDTQKNLMELESAELESVQPSIE